MSSSLLVSPTYMLQSVSILVSNLDEVSLHHASYRSAVFVFYYVVKGRSVEYFCLVDSMPLAGYVSLGCLGPSCLVLSFF